MRSIGEGAQIMRFVRKGSNFNFLKIGGSQIAKKPDFDKYLIDNRNFVVFLDFSR